MSKLAGNFKDSINFNENDDDDNDDVGYYYYKNNNNNSVFVASPDAPPLPQRISSPDAPPLPQRRATLSLKEHFAVKAKDNTHMPQKHNSNVPIPIPVTNFIHSSISNTSVITPTSKPTPVNTPRPAAPVSTLHLPMSMFSADNLSPRMWAYAQTGDASSPYNLVLDNNKEMMRSNESRILEDSRILRRAVAETKVVTSRQEWQPNGTPEHIKTAVYTATGAASEKMQPPTLGAIYQAKAAARAAAIGGDTSPVPTIPASVSSSTATASASASTLASGRRKPVDDGRTGIKAGVAAGPSRRMKEVAPVEYNIPRLFFQIVDIKVKNTLNVFNVHCTVQVGIRKAWTCVLPLTKVSKKGFGLVSAPKEGFFFDVPLPTHSHTQATPILVTLYAGCPPSASNLSRLQTANHADSAPTLPKLGGVAGSVRSVASSVRSTSSGFFGGLFGGGLRKSMSMAGAGTNTVAAAAIAAPAAEPNSLYIGGGGTSSINTSVSGTYLASAMFGADVDVAGQTKRTYSVQLHAGPGAAGAVGSKRGDTGEVATVVFQVGFVMDEEYPPPPPVPEVEHEDFLNFYLATKSGGQFWKKYWVILRNGMFETYNIEYKERKPMISSLPLENRLIKVRTADPEVMCSPHCLELHFNHREGEEVAGGGIAEGENDASSSKSELAKWRVSVRDPELDCVYIMADSKEALDMWEAKLWEIIRRTA